MCLINAAQEHFITQTSKKSETPLKNFMGPRGPGPTYGTEGREKQIPVLKYYANLNLSFYKLCQISLDDFIFSYKSNKQLNQE